MAARRELLRPLSDKKYSTLESPDGPELEAVDLGAAAGELEGGPPNENGLVVGAAEEAEGPVVDEAAGGLKLKDEPEVVPLVWERDDEAAAIEAPNN